MTRRGECAEIIMRSHVMAVIRLSAAPTTLGAAQALITGGMPVIEFSLSGAAALDGLREFRHSQRALVGAGTVRSIGDAEVAVEEGAQFLVGPTFDASLNRWAKAEDILYIPGAFSPLEIDAAARAGAELVKVFPARTLGPQYVRDLLAPMPDLRLVPTGGVDQRNAREFLMAGAVAVAIGTSLVNEKSVADPEDLTAATGRLLGALKEALTD